MATHPKIAVVGTGYWGKNHVRVFHELGYLHSIFDHHVESALNMSKQYEGTHAAKSYQDILDNPDIGGIVIATPAETHFDLAMRALQSGKDVLVEKPITLYSEEAAQLQKIATENKRILMVGHLLKYHPALARLKSFIDSGELGKLEYIYSNRLNLGKIRSEENILWSFAPHDISLMLWFTGKLPIQANVVGGSYLQPNIADTTISSFLFPGGVRGHIYVSWLHPFKEQRLVLVGQKKMAVFDDQHGLHKLMIFDKSVHEKDGVFTAQKPEGYSLDYDSNKEPLKEEALHFLECIQNKSQPLTSGEEGVAVLKVLEACQKSLEMNGQAVQV